MESERKCAHCEANSVAAIARAIVIGVVCLILAGLAGCWITYEWTLREVQAVGGEIHRREMGPGPDVFVLPKVEEKR